MSNVRLILISHFYNEEYLLPEWILHHRNIFDHAILIDYHSTDSSVQLIKQLAPSWEVRTSQNKQFDSELVDQEVERIEAEFVGDDIWKICLNTTEFLFSKDPKKIIAKYKDSYKKISCHGLGLYDAPSLVGAPIVSPLLKQRHFGIPRIPYRHRLLHCLVCGNYSRGRHGNDRVTKDCVITDEILIVWLGYSPLTEEFWSRKLQISSKMSEFDKQHGYGIQHLLTRQQMLAEFNERQRFSIELLDYAPYRLIYDQLYKDKNETKNSTNWWLRLYRKLSLFSSRIFRSSGQ